MYPLPRPDLLQCTHAVTQPRDRVTRMSRYSEYSDPLLYANAQRTPFSLGTIYRVVLIFPPPVLFFFSFFPSIVPLLA
jgi:hypothetical protein